MNLDGKDKIVAVPFDAHEQATRGEQDRSTVAEFPKAVDHVQKDNAPQGHKEPIVVNSAEEEAAHNAANAAPAKPEDPAPTK